MGTRTGSRFKGRIWRTPKGWRWTIRSRNGNKTANGGQAYSRLCDCSRMAHRAGVGFEIVRWEIVR